MHEGADGPFISRASANTATLDAPSYSAAPFIPWLNPLAMTSSQR